MGNVDQNVLLVMCWLLLITPVLLVQSTAGHAPLYQIQLPQGVPNAIHLKSLITAFVLMIVLQLPLKYSLILPMAQHVIPVLQTV